VLLLFHHDKIVVRAGGQTGQVKPHQTVVLRQAWKIGLRIRRAAGCHRNIGFLVGQR